ncbi:hypothetical protein KIPB_008905 [Kipferlia bialata]|uniref:Uncharacterized protein n=1 Tax=Kipferlia bialata TaxID=797122 RepID=A0A9K3D0Q5_9EUKA|nr:hypothetical protein KIPB_008905 [Kipferlia bialata]|eukprot:g8905.t1
MGLLGTIYEELQMYVMAFSPQRASQMIRGQRPPFNTEGSRTHSTSTHRRDNTRGTSSGLGRTFQMSACGS